MRYLLVLTGLDKRRSEQPEDPRRSRSSQINVMRMNTAVQYESHFIFELSQTALEASKSGELRERSNVYQRLLKLESRDMYGSSDICIMKSADITTPCSKTRSAELLYGR